MGSVIFGAGYWGETLKRGLEKYCGVRICAIIDNDKSKWGKKIDDVVISSPQLLLDMNFEKVFVCVWEEDKYSEIEMQLVSMGIPRKKIEIMITTREYIEAFIEDDLVDESIDRNNYIYSFERYEKNITMFLPNYKVDHIQKRIVKQSDFVESYELEYLRNAFLQGGNVILDIGANIGNHTVFFSKICNAKKVYAFEPIAETYNILCRNISLNHIEDTVIAYNVALGNVPGNAKIKNFSLLNIGGTTVEEADDGDISMKRLDDYEFERIDFIKIDVERYEHELLKGAKKTLAKHSPVIFIEIFDDCFSKVDKLLRSYGYTRSHSIKYNHVYTKG